MPRIVKKRSVKAGLPPGSLVYVGDKSAGKAKVTRCRISGGYGQGGIDLGSYRVFSVQ